MTRFSSTELGGVGEAVNVGGIASSKKPSVRFRSTSGTNRIGVSHIPELVPLRTPPETGFPGKSVCSINGRALGSVVIGSSSVCIMIAWAQFSSCSNR